MENPTVEFRLDPHVLPPVPTQTGYEMRVIDAIGDVEYHWLSHSGYELDEIEFLKRPPTRDMSSGRTVYICETLDGKVVSRKSGRGHSAMQPGSATYATLYRTGVKATVPFGFHIEIVPSSGLVTTGHSLHSAVIKEDGEILVYLIEGTNSPPLELPSPLVVKMVVRKTYGMDFVIKN